MRQRLQEPLYRSLRGLYRRVKDPLAPIIRRHPRLYRLAVAARDSFRGALRPGHTRGEGAQGIPCACEPLGGGTSGFPYKGLPQWLLEEWKAIHAIEPQLFPDASIQRNVVTDFIRPSRVGEHYLDLCTAFGPDVSHVFLVPWLKRGGADLVTINYVQALAGRGLSGAIAVIATEDDESPWAGRLPAGVRMIEFGKDYRHLGPEEQEKLLLRVLLQRAPGVVHTINSLLGFNLFIKYGEALRSCCRLYASAFCEDITPEGRSLGYPVCFLPQCFDVLTAVLTDNRYVVERLCDLFSFEMDTFRVHYQPVEMRAGTRPGRASDRAKPLNVLWASRLDRQKRPDILLRIAGECASLPVVFHVNGSPVCGTRSEDVESYLAGMRRLENVRYHGPFDGLHSLPLEDYDVFLYTSEWDGLPNVLLEAVAAGLPVVAPAVGGIPEIIRDRETGFLVDRFDDVGGYVSCLARLCADRSELGAVSERGRELLIRRHSAERFAEDLLRTPFYVQDPPRDGRAESPEERRQMGNTMTHHERDLKEEKDFWDTELSLKGQFSEHIEKLIRKEGRKEAFPAVFFERLVPALEARFGIRRPVSVIELGSGPLSTLAHGVDTGLLAVTAVDVLADAYRDLYRKHRIADFPVQPVAGTGEGLLDMFRAESFHCAYVRNALDHTRDIVRSFGNLVSLVRKGGYVVLQHHVKEGSREGWSGLHGWDIDWNERGLVAVDSKGNVNVLQEGLGLDLVYVLYSSPEFSGWLDCVFRRR